METKEKEEIKDKKNEKKTKDKSKKIDKKEYDELNEKYSKLEGTYQRLLADFENYKRRTSNEILESKTKGKSEVFEKLLDIIDNFDRSMEYDVQTEEFKKGIEMLHSMFNQRLEDLGLEEVETTGILDPNKHQAVMIDTVEGLEDDEIIEVLQKGYCVEQRVLRPAMVKVNKIN